MIYSSELWRPKHRRLFRGLVVANGGFAFAIIFAWAVASILVAEPMAWATWHVIQRENAKSLLHYPLNILWMLPTFAIAIAWVTRNARKERLALGLLVLPILLFGLTIVMYHMLGRYNLR
jgi:hypothetical protein